MSYLEHIIRCNTYSAEKYQPFLIDGETMGWVQKPFMQALLNWPDVFYEENSALSINPKLINAEARTEACKPILTALHEQGVIDSWVDELYAITHAYGEEPRLLIERASVTFFGVRGYGVHLNGLVKKADGVYIWIARRTKDKPFWPGMLDQMVAGGQPVGIGRFDNLIKESAEEANIPEALTKTAKFVSEIHYRGETHRGMNIDTLFNYDLWLPEDFIPENTDGEVDEFILMPLEEMAEITDTTSKFKDNCNLVNIDLLIRQGLINATHQDYDEIKSGLYAPIS